MKRLLLTCSALFAIVASALADEMDMDKTQGLFGLKPEYVHVLINPLPTYGLIIGIAVLFFGLIFRNVATRNTGLFIILICSGITWAVFHYGEHAYNDLYMNLDPESKRWADIHMDRAESFIWAFYITAIVSIIALAKRKRERVRPVNPPSPTPTSTTSQPVQPTPATTSTVRKLSPAATWLAVVALICAIVSFALGSWISRAGGRIRHTEFREGPAPTNAPAEHEHHHG